MKKELKSKTAKESNLNANENVLKESEIESTNNRIELEKENLISIEDEKSIKEINNTDESLENNKNINENLEDENSTKNSAPDDNTLIPVLESIVKDENKKSPKNKFFIILFIIIFFLILLLSTVFALFNTNSNKIVNGVSIKGIDVSGLTKQEALDKVSQTFNEKLGNSITLKYQEQELNIFPEQLSISFDINSSVDLAYSIGKNGNILKNNFDIISSLFFKTNISPRFSYNEDALNTLISEFETNLPNKLVQPSYYVDGSNLIITKGIDGVVINSEQLKFEIIYSINNLICNNTINVPTIDKKADDINIDTIHSEVYKEPKDAYYTKDPFVVYPHVEGVDFAITLDEAKKMLQEDKDTYIIPLKFVTPSVTTNNIGTEAFPDLLATYKTTYSTKNVNRSTNIRLASEKINGIVIMPGETFSYNTTVGKRTAAAGFKTAAVYSGGEVTTGIGGGICQVSSTLYNSVLLANLEIVERYNHGFNPGYVPAGRDATVSWGGPDFKFKNNRNYPVKIVCSGTGGTITVKVFGLKENNEYDVEIESYITSYIQYKTITKKDSTLGLRHYKSNSKWFKWV